MKNIEIIYRELLYQAIEKKRFEFTQSELSKKFEFSLSVVNLAVKKLEKIGAVSIRLRGFKVLDIKKILYFWASVRNLERDILFSARIELPVREIERDMPFFVIFACYSAYKFRFKDVPADYSEVYVYADEEDIDKIKKRFSSVKIRENSKNPNFFVLKKDSYMGNKEMPIAQIFADLWNLKEWYSKDFINALEEKIKSEVKNYG